MTYAATYAVVTGAPGAGKSATVNELLKLESDLVVFDLDWLHESAGELARTPIYSDASTWPAYNKLWFAVLAAVAKNSKKPVLFCPLDKADLDDSFPAVKWLLLDCDDAERRRRLAKRGWDEMRVLEALEDARDLREQISTRVDTVASDPVEVARKVLEWTRQSHTD